MLFSFKDRKLEIKNRVLVMGIINVTPDSFSENGKNFEPETAIENSLAMIRDGADIMDIGGESTRPGAAPVDAASEISRIIPVIRGLRELSDIPISVDTYKAEVAGKALENGADIINDISGFQRDAHMIPTAKKFAAGCIVMHMRGTPETMQTLCQYENIIHELYEYFEQATAMLEEGEVRRTSICLDPGIGFSKTAEQNMVVIRNLSTFKELGRPILLGVSRKSFISKILNAKSPEERLWGTAAAVSCGIMNGANIVRVHDVKEMRQVCDMTSKIMALDF